MAARPLVLCGLGGAVGILNGFALGYLLWEERHLSFAAFATALAVAAALALIIETLRHWIQHPKAAAVSVPQILSTFMVIAVSELLIAAAHTAVPQVVEALEHAPGHAPGHEPLIPEDPAVQFNLLVTAAIWLIAGTVIAVRLGRDLRNAPGDSWAGVKFGAEKGARAGFLVAFGIVLGGGLLLRLIALLELAAVDPTVSNKWDVYLYAWRESGRDTDVLTDIIAAWLPTSALSILGGVVRWLGVGPVVIIYLGLLATAFILGQRTRYRWPFYAVSALGLFYLLMPLLGFELVGEETIYLLLLGSAFAAIVFGIPATILGALSPLWQAFQDRRRTWVAIAAGTGMLLAVVTAARVAWPVSFHLFDIPWWSILLLSALSCAAAVYFWRNEEIIDLWPFTALLVALAVGAFTALTATFVGVWAQLHVINASLTTGYSIGPYACLQEYRMELLWLQFQPPDEMLKGLQALQDGLRNDLAQRQTMIDQSDSNTCLPGEDVTDCLARALLGRDLWQVCRAEDQAMIERFDAYVAAAAQLNQWAEQGAPQRFEIAIAGSFGFWVTMVLLAAHRRYAAEAHR
jgi:hypothetical protein